MTFRHLCEYFSELEAVSSRIKMTGILARLFAEADREEIDKICYLLQGRVCPLYEDLEFGMADRMVIRAIGQAYGASAEEVTRLFKKYGDLGETAGELEKRRGNSLFSSGLGEKKANPTVAEVYEIFKKIAKAGGEGSQGEKISSLAAFLFSADNFSAKFGTRLVLDKLRLGFSDATIIMALAMMISQKSSETLEERKAIAAIKDEIEKAYNVRPDIGLIAQKSKSKNQKWRDEKIKLDIEPTVGVPILSARAERMTSGKEIIEQIGECSVEPKYDGFRLQGHYKKFQAPKLKFQNGEEAFVKLFTRNLEDQTAMFPDLVEAVKKQILASEAIFDAEAVGFNPKTGEFLPFQEIVQRKRKYEIERMAGEVPLKLFVFDVLSINGESLIAKPYKERRKILLTLFRPGERIQAAPAIIVKTAEELETFFEAQIGAGLEGIIAKKLDGEYEAGARGWNWIKYKRSYSGKLEDTIDAVVMGYDFGQGKRRRFGIGDFLIGVYDKKADAFKTVAKIGTGLTDKEWKTLKAQSSKFKVQKKPENYEVGKAMECDAWVEPSMVVVIRADEITRSPVHTAGFALRFPRLETFRSDKLPEDATSLEEIEKMHKTNKTK